MSTRIASELQHGGHEDPAPVVSRAELLEIVEGAASAPSGDNCQPFRVRLAAQGFELWFVADRARSLLDPGLVASRIACGAFLEAAHLRAGELGWIAEVDLSAELEPDAPWAFVRLVRRGGPIRCDALSAQLSLRETNRRVFDGSPLSGLQRATLSAAALPSAHVELIDDRCAIERLAGLAEIAERCRAETQAAHAELHRWLRWSCNEVEATRDGLDVRTLALSHWELRLLRVLAPWSRMKLAIGLGAARANGAYARRLVRSASSLGAITVSGSSAATEVMAGRVLERVWLTAASLGLAFSPVAALPLLLERVANPGDSPLSARHAGVMRQLLPEFRALCRAGDDDRVLFLFRVGRAAPMPVRALRRGTDALIGADASDQHGRS